MGDAKTETSHTDLSGGRGTFRGTLFVILSAVIFGTMPLMTKTLFAHGGNSYTAAFYRFAVGGLILLFISKAVLKQKILTDSKTLLHVAGLSISYAVMLALLYSSYAYMDTGLATTLHFLYPAAVILMRFLFFRLKPSKRELLCLALALLGGALLGIQSAGGSLLGMILAVTSGIAYAFYIVFYPKSRAVSMNPFVLAFWISLFAAAILAVFNTAAGTWQFPTDFTGYAMMTLLAVLTDVVALVFFQIGLHEIGGVRSSLLSTLEPATGLLIGVLVFGERFTVLSAASILCILLSVIILIVKKKGKAASA